MKHLLIFALAAFLLFSCTPNKPEITGELKTWHKITLTFDGPESSEMTTPNPFTDYRLDVIFSKGDQNFVVPGYFAADGQAAFTSADSGNKWRVHFSPNAEGEWTYKVSFKKGAGIAVSKDEGESAKFMDGATGTFMVEKTDKSGRDLRAHGRLQYVGEHYQRFAETGQYFLKCGADAPENFLAYYEIDNTPNVGDRLKKWEDHAGDYNQDAEAFLWGPDKQKGKNLLGAINYLSSKGMNAFSFLTFNIDGDDRNVYPYLLKVSNEEYEKAANVKKNPKQWEELTIHDRFDVSKMDQWEQIFAYGEMKGMFLHFKTQENENDQKMDGGEVGPERKLYYRELIARYSHHLALNWNLGEEMTQTVQQVKDMAAYFAKNDPYKNLVVVHTFPEQHDKYYAPLVGENSELTGLSIQTNQPDFSRVHSAVNKWVKASAKAGKKWVVAVDEPGDAQHALITDEENPEHNDARINGLWGTFMAGGCGTEWYFGYKHPHSDLTCESWRSRDLFWDQCNIALDFFNENEIPVETMVNANELTSTENDYVFAKTGQVYLIYSKTGENIEINLPDVGYTATWFNPRNGKSLQITESTANEEIKLQCPTEQDWLLYLQK
ncbi:DUF5060 domain-containing protein [Draconibacterium sediminis]|uniref:DUF5060 domain-containing protein n=1 Tax=Draconibacterium sediminis TaxID=1544798 RepID=A0A0D8JFK5_9BACT|nr:DUF5060 domain-containing protein [Draconibacterium sediminis]KJF45326.1 hypothetical protein LH29_08080 [Draconibacterium sediminis]